MGGLGLLRVHDFNVVSNYTGSSVTEVGMTSSLEGIRVRIMVYCIWVLLGAGCSRSSVVAIFTVIHLSGSLSSLFYY